MADGPPLKITNSIYEFKTVSKLLPTYLRLPYSFLTFIKFQA